MTVAQNSVSKINTTSISILVWVLAAALVIPLFVTALPYGKAFPSSDEWTFLQPNSGSLQWLFAQHVDHRIPIQKAVQISALYLAHFDFRMLLAINFLAAALASGLFIATARLYRGRYSVGDIFIPLCLLSLGAGYTQWGFEFQFLSSVLFSSIFMLAIVMYGRSERRIYLLAACAALFLSSWCGLNGVIFSTAVSAMLAAFIILRRQYPGAIASTALAATIATNILQWLLWTPSAASVGQLDILRAAHFALSMFGSPLIVYVAPYQTMKLAFMAILIVAGAAAAIFRVVQSKRLTDFSIFAVLVAYIFLVLTTAYGRSKLTSWQPGLEMHYGTLAMPLVISAWIAISSSVSRKIEIGSGLALVLLFALAYRANYNWRVDSEVYQHADRLAAQMAIAGSEDANKVAAEHIKQFYYVDGDDIRHTVASGISELRKHEHYGMP